MCSSVKRQDLKRVGQRSLVLNLKARNLFEISTIFKREFRFLISLQLFQNVLTIFPDVSVSKCIMWCGAAVSHIKQIPFLIPALC